MCCPRIIAQWASFVLLSIFLVYELCRIAAHGRYFFRSGDGMRSFTNVTDVTLVVLPVSHCVCMALLHCECRTLVGAHRLLVCFLPFRVPTTVCIPTAQWYGYFSIVVMPEAAELFGDDWAKMLIIIRGARSLYQMARASGMEAQIEAQRARAVKLVVQKRGWLTDMIGDYYEVFANIDKADDGAVRGAWCGCAREDSSQTKNGDEIKISDQELVAITKKLKDEEEDDCYGIEELAGIRDCLKEFKCWPTRSADRSYQALTTSEQNAACCRCCGINNAGSAKADKNKENLLDARKTIAIFK